MSTAWMLLLLLLIIMMMHDATTLAGDGWLASWRICNNITLV